MTALLLWLEAPLHLGGSIPASEGAIRFPFLPAPACSGSSAALRGAAANRKRGLLR